MLLCGGGVQSRDDAPQKRRLRDEPGVFGKGARRSQLFEREAPEGAPPDQPWPEREGADERRRAAERSHGDGPALARSIPLAI